MLVQSDKKAEVVLSDGRFVSIHSVKMAHMYCARDPDPLMQTMKLMALITRIDDQEVKLADILNLKLEDYNLILDNMSK